MMALSFALLYLMRFILYRLRASVIIAQSVMGWLAIFSACYVVYYSMGANNAGDAVGPIANLGIIDTRILVTIGGGSLAMGAITFGRRVTDTVGKSITPLDLPGAFVAQVSAAFGIHLFPILGIPISTSCAIVGAVAGKGLERGVRSVSKKTILIILIGWVLIPSLAAFSSFLLYRLITMFG